MNAQDYFLISKVFFEAYCKKINITFCSLSSCLLNYTTKDYRVSFRVICFINRREKSSRLIGALYEERCFCCPLAISECNRQFYIINSVIDGGEPLGGNVILRLSPHFSCGQNMKTPVPLSSFASQPHGLITIII